LSQLLAAEFIHEIPDAVPVKSRQVFAESPAYWTYAWIGCPPTVCVVNWHGQLIVKDIEAEPPDVLTARWW
jgi:hypothetical protein